MEIARKKVHSAEKITGQLFKICVKTGRTDPFQRLKTSS